MAKPGAQRYQDIPLEIAGSTKFSRYAKISVEQTFNMFLVDQWLTPFAGYQNVQTINPTGEGRGIYSSAKLSTLFAVIDNNVYKFDTALSRTRIGNLQTFIGDVFITENNAGQILFSDSTRLYVYNSTTTVFSTSGIDFIIDFVPGFVTFQNGRFVSPAATSGGNFLWALSDPNNGLSWPDDAQHRGALQTKPDKTVATIRFPGSGNNLFVFGATVTEQWQDVGAQLFPYQRSTAFNIDYGCINPATIAELENKVCFIGINEKSGPIIMYSNGGDPIHISTDGIDDKLAFLKNPSNCYGFMFRQNGHLFYVATWPTDQLSYAYDFNTDKFYTLCDENMNAFIPKRVAFFNNLYFFVSLKDGNLYELSNNIYDYDYGNGQIFEIPRIRITPSLRLPDQSRFIAGYSGFCIEQGQFDYDYRDTTFILGTEDTNEISTQNHNQLIGGGYNFRNNVPRIDMSLSKDGGVNFGSNKSIDMLPLGNRANRLMWRNLGAANELVHQFRFHGFSRFVCNNGVTGIYQ
jgi:hypothetical protein